MIQRSIVVDDGFGEPVQTWEDVREIWAEKIERTSSNTERFVADQRQSDRWLVFRIRWTRAITAMERVIFEGRAYDILYVSEIGRREGVELGTKGSDRFEDAVL